jgi:PAS domain-containing protein
MPLGFFELGPLAFFENLQSCYFTREGRFRSIRPEPHHTEYKSIIHRDDVQDFENWWQALMNSKNPGKTELRLRRSDGEYRWFEVSAVPVHDEQGNVIRWYGINFEPAPATQNH